MQLSGRRGGRTEREDEEEEEEEEEEVGVPPPCRCEASNEIRSPRESKHRLRYTCERLRFLRRKCYLMIWLGREAPPLRVEQQRASLGCGSVIQSF